MNCRRSKPVVQSYNAECSCTILRAGPTYLQALTLRACTTPSGAMLAVLIP